MNQVCENTSKMLKLNIIENFGQLLYFENNFKYNFRAYISDRRFKAKIKNKKVEYLCTVTCV